MATVTASKYGYVNASSELGWTSARNASTGNSIQNQSASTNTLQVSTKYTSGSKGSEWFVQRQFLAFNVTAYQSGYTITSLKLYYLPTTSTAGSGGAGMKIALVQSTAQGNADTNLAVADFNNFDDTVDYAANDGSMANTWRDLATLQSFDLNATAIAVIANGTANSYLKICIMDYLNDYPDTAPTVNSTSHKAYCNFSTIPYLSFTATTTGYSNDVIGVSSANIDSVNAIATADISEIIGV